MEVSSPAPKRTHARKATAASSKHSEAPSPPQTAFSTPIAKPKLPEEKLSLATGESHHGPQTDYTLKQAKPSENTQQDSSSSVPPPIAGGPYAADFNGIITDITNHEETVDSHYASQGYDAMGTVDTESFHQLGANLHLKTQSLPILDNLATQILNTLAKSTYREILAIATEPDSDAGQAYATLKSLFDHTKKVYSIQEPFLNPQEFGFVENAHLETIKKANMATFVSSVFGSQDVGFYHLNENFLDTFIADGNRMLKNQAQLFLDLKTQAYISAIANGDRSRKEILDDLFPHDLEDRLLKRRHGAKQLSPSEADFMQRARNRRKALLEEPSTEEATKALPEKYVWEDFLRDISTYVAKNFEAIAGVPAPKMPRSGRASRNFAPDQKQQPQGQQTRGQRRPNQAQFLPQTLQVQRGNHLEGMQPSNQMSTPQSNVASGATDDIAEKAARAADYAMQDFGDNQGALLPHQSSQYNQPPTEAQNSESSQNQQPQNNREIRYHFENKLHPNVPAPPPPSYFQHIQYQPSQQMQQPWQGQMGIGQLHQSYSDQQLIPNPAQSAPTQVLYERARQAATAKASPSSRRAGTPSQRRPWTTDEENSLMAGLDRVKGPHWSQILAMFGPGGTINEVLKDRNQVQLKDKARNLKLFFLKSGIEVPYYLQFVTGELKTRAPGQAAKNEAKEKATSDEDRAHIEGVIALAGGSMQEADQAMTGVEGQGESSHNGVVPTADMGSAVNLNGRNGMENTIDPDIKDAIANGVGNATSSTDAPTDGVGEFSITGSQGLQQMPHGLPADVRTNGTTMNGSFDRPMQPVTMQLEAAARNITSPSPNVDPALSV
ncbi:hypothetical protein OEA41_005585 [Lepraria neglecta]|uniref:Telomere repeat-binding factor dimerisation domain-containing protein n=1 Tax=Lepraria neglecta TaxID=209136 RepID=A0AAD9Z657_9LECA|nr:hypothetical protein OEA41_005585 [Lepraria neglecta]